MENPRLEIDGKEVEVLIDNGGGIEGFMIDGELVDMAISNKGSRFIDENIDMLMEEAVSVIEVWRSRHVANRAYMGEG